MKNLQDVTKMSTEDLLMLYNAIMAGAYPGDETEIEQELQDRGYIG